RVVPGLEQVPPSMKLTLPSVTAVLSHFVTVAVSVTEVWNLELAGAAPSVVAVPAGQLLLVPSQVGATSQTPEGPHTVPAGLLASAGQVVLVPVQVSAGSQTPAEARQIAPALPAGCVQAGEPTVPLQVSVVQGLPSSVHAVPAVLTVSAGQLALVPVQFSAMSHSLTAARHTVLAERKASAGQLLLVPTHVSATSQTPADGRQTVPAGLFASAGQVELVPVQVSAGSQTPAEARQTVPAL